MLVAVVSANEDRRNLIRGILGRYMWRIDSDTFISGRASLIHDIIKELSLIDKESMYAVNFYKSKKKAIKGFEVIKIGKMNSKVLVNDNFFSIKTIF